MAPPQCSAVSRLLARRSRPDIGNTSPSYRYSSPPVAPETPVGRGSPCIWRSGSCPGRGRSPRGCGSSPHVPISGPPSLSGGVFFTASQPAVCEIALTGLRPSPPAGDTGQTMSEGTWRPCGTGSPCSSRWMRASPIPSDSTSSSRRRADSPSRVTWRVTTRPTPSMSSLSSAPVGDVLGFRYSPRLDGREHHVRGCTCSPNLGGVGPKACPAVL